MEDMASALGSILNNPQAMQQIMSLASQLGLGAPEAPQAPAGEAGAMPVQAPAVPSAPAAVPAAPPAAPAANPFSIPATVPAPAAPQANPMAGLLGGIDLNTITKISQIMNGLNQRDQNVELLLALKPHFGEKRQKKVDDAIRIMQLVKMLPLLKETGIFGSLFGGEE